VTTAPPDDPVTDGGCAEDIEDALVDGDRVFTPGTARSAFSHRTFRTIYLAAFASNIGTWMQNVVLGAFAYKLTHSGVFVAVVTAAQLGPLLMFSAVGGLIADAFDRKKSLMLLSIQQAIFSIVLAFVTIPHHPNKVAMVGVVFIVGVGNALFAPIFSAVVPILVPRQDLSGAISLNSVQMNASRVIGPFIGAMIYTHVGPSWVFVVNALSFGFVIIGLLRVTLPDPPASGNQGLHRLLEGLTVARNDRVVGQSLVVIATFSFLSLPFITELPKIANDHFGIDAKSNAYGLLYAAFGLGAVIGALSIGTVFAHSSKAMLTRRGLVGFAIVLAIFGALRTRPLAYLTILVLGCVYFAVITSLSTVLQEDLDDAVRGKVMALWIMGFGGVVPFGGLLGGALMGQIGIFPVLAGGAVVAVALAWWADLTPPSVVGPVADGVPSP
jgi:predicted MFS family arabinose efflux permease